MLRDLLRPKALLGHLLVLTVASTCVALGQWQLSRLAEVRESNERLEARLQQEAMELGDVVSRVRAGEAYEDFEFRRVVAEGVYRPEQEVLQRNREHLGRSGFHILTPFDIGEGVVLVRRGWVPPDHDEPPVEAAGVPEGTVRLTGVLELSVEQPSFGPRDPDDGVLARVFHPDTSRLDRQVDGELFGMVVRLESQAPAHPHELPLSLLGLELDEANHRSYAVQWHVFAVLALLTYGVWLYRRFNA